MKYLRIHILAKKKTMTYFKQLFKKLTVVEREKFDPDEINLRLLLVIDPKKIYSRADLKTARSLTGH